MWKPHAIVKAKLLAYYTTLCMPARRLTSKQDIKSQEGYVRVILYVLTSLTDNRSQQCMSSTRGSHQPSIRRMVEAGKHINDVRSMGGRSNGYAEAD